MAVAEQSLFAFTPAIQATRVVRPQGKNHDPPMKDFLLYAVTVMIWGSSWLAIKYQLGVVAPGISLLYRIALAAAMLVAFCLMTRRNLRFTLKEHGFIALQGLFLFSTNYFLIYLGSQYLTSGLVAVAFSTVVVMNILLGALLFRMPIRPRVACGAAVGIGGIVLIFWPEVAAFDLARDGSLGLALTIAGTLSASLGMLVSGRNQKHGLPVVQSNAIGMTYGAGLLALAALFSGSSFDFDPSPLYIGSLLFLVVFATVIGFWSYLTLLGRIGADRAAYASVLFPIIALGLSTAFEEFEWTPAAGIGLALVLAGNALVLIRPGGPRKISVENTEQA